MVFDSQKNITELPCVVPFILTQLVVTEIEYFELFEVFELMLEPFETSHTKPVA